MEGQELCRVRYISFAYITLYLNRKHLLIALGQKVKIPQELKKGQRTKALQWQRTNILQDLKKGNID